MGGCVRHGWWDADGVRGLRCCGLGLGQPDILALLGQMSQDGLIGIWAIAGYIGVGQAIKQVTVTCFDSVEPCLLDWKAKAGMVESNQGTDAGEVHVARIKHRAGGVGCQSHDLGCTVEVEDRIGFASWAKGLDALAEMQGCFVVMIGLVVGLALGVSMAGRLGVAAVRGKCQSQGPVISRQPLGTQRLSVGSTTVTPVLVKVMM
jgi:hypothetical protein